MKNILVVSFLLSSMFGATVLGEEITGEEGKGSKRLVKKAEKVKLEDRIKAVQGRMFLKKGRFEISPSFVSGLNDPFTQNLGGQLHLEYFIAESFGINANLGYAVDITADNTTFVTPKTFLEKNELAVPDMGKMRYFAGGGAAWSPIYGKVSFLSELIVHFDMFLLLNLGIVGVEYRGWENGVEKDMGGVNLMSSLGIGNRVFLNRWLVLKFELKNIIYKMELKPRYYKDGITDIQNHMLGLIGLGIYIPMQFEEEF
ncbi:MAG: outer membrane beta-barrel domain-containing protein [Deltaproteobacteria bacterium]|nr:outer membrane beta-barrel domain-containing protein [Deltaproteobacteria bacterium]